MRILGIDPGTNHFACSVVEWKDSIELLDVRSFNYKTKEILEKKLSFIYDDIKDICVKYQPDLVSVEGQFYGTNVRTLRSLCESVGAIKVSCLRNSSSQILDYAPTELKLALTGKGTSSKIEMVEAAQSLFKREFSSDEADSIGAVIAHILFCGSQESYEFLEPFFNPEILIEYFILLRKSKLKKKEKKDLLEAKKDIYNAVDKITFVNNTEN